MARSAIGVIIFLGVVTSATLVVGAGSASARTDLAPASPAPLVVGIDAGGGPWFTAYTAPGCLHGQSIYQTGCWLTGGLAAYDFTLGGLHVAVGDVTGDGRADVVTVPGNGGRADVRVFDSSGAQEAAPVYAGLNAGGRELALGDVNGDGRSDFVLGNESWGGPNVEVLDGRTGKRLSFFGAFSDPTGQHGIRVAAGDVNGDGRAEIVTANGPGLEPRVSVYAGTPTSFFPTPLRSFLAFDPSVRSGVRVATGDLNGDGRSDIVAIAATTSGVTLKVFDGATGTVLRTLFPLTDAAPDSLRVAVGDLTGDGVPDIVVAGDTPGGPKIEVLTALGTAVEALPGVSYHETIAVGDVTGDGKADLVASDGPGADSRVTVFKNDGRLEVSFSAYGPSFTNGIRVAAGDFAGDGGTEYVTGQGPGGTSQVDVLDRDGASLLTLHPFAGAGSDGVYVAAGDVDGDRHADVVVGAGAGGEPRVKVFDRAGKQLASFLAFDPAFHGGVRVAVGDLDGDGKSEIVAGTGPGDPAMLRVFTGSGTLLRTIVPFDPFFTGGVFPAVGRLDGQAEIAVGPGAGGDGFVRTFDATGVPLARFQPYGSGYDVRVAIGDVTGQGRGEIVATSGRVSPAWVGVFRADGSEVGQFLAHPEFQGGLYLGVEGPLGPPLALTDPAVRAVEGARAEVLVAVSDPEHAEAVGDVGARVSWGDQTSSTARVTELADGRIGILGYHRYRHPGVYTLAVGVTGSFHRYAFATGAAIVRDAPLVGRGRTLRLSVSRTVGGTVATFVDGNRFATAAGFKATIAWGDGSRSHVAVRSLGGGRLAVSGAHTYRRRGTYTVVCRLVDADGAHATARSVVRPAR